LKSASTGKNSTVPAITGLNVRSIRLRNHL
jgi:hypothetical protein